MADLVLGDTPRERLFELARRLPATDVQILLAAANDCANRLPEIAIARSAGRATFSREAGRAAESAARCCKERGTDRETEPR